MSHIFTLETVSPILLALAIHALDKQDRQKQVQQGFTDATAIQAAAKEMRFKSVAPAKINGTECQLIYKVPGGILGFAQLQNGTYAPIASNNSAARHLTKFVNIYNKVAVQSLVSQQGLDYKQYKLPNGTVIIETQNKSDNGKEIINMQIDGTLHVEAIGYQGPACSQGTNYLRRLGTVRQEIKKPEYGGVRGR